MAQVQREAEDQDEALPFFSVREAAHFRDLFRKAHAKYGRTVTVVGDRGWGDDGSEMGLWNLAADCHKYPQAMWPEIVREQIGATQINPLNPFEGMSRAKVLRSVYLKLWWASGLPDINWFPHARTLAPGLVELPSVHVQRAVIPMRPCDIEQFGGLDALRRTGWDNLANLPVEQREMIETPEGGSFRVLLGQSSFTASRILTLERLVAQLYLDPAMPYGVLAAVPNRNEVAVHVIKDETAVPTIVNLATFARLRSASAPGLISPHVYWVTPDRFEQVGGLDKDGRFHVLHSPDFRDTMDRMLAATRRGPKGPPRTSRPM